MNQLSKHTVIGFLFLFLGTIELIGCGIVEGMHVYTAIIDWLIFFLFLHLILGYGFLVARLICIMNKDQKPTIDDKKDQP